MAMQRSEQDPALQWRLTDIFESEAAWEQALAGAQQDVAALAAYRGRLGESADTLL